MFRWMLLFVKSRGALIDFVAARSHFYFFMGSNMDALAGGFFGIFLLFFAFSAMLLAVPLAILWEQDRWIFKDVPFWLMFVLVPYWFFSMIWREVFHA